MFVHHKGYIIYRWYLVCYIEIDWLIHLNLKVLLNRIFTFLFSTAALCMGLHGQMSVICTVLSNAPFLTSHVYFCTSFKLNLYIHLQDLLRFSDPLFSSAANSVISLLLLTKSFNSQIFSAESSSIVFYFHIKSIEIIIWGKKL